MLSGALALWGSISADAQAADVTDDFGFSEWVSPGPDGTTYDASTARWDFSNHDAEHPVKATEGCNGPNINRYPVSLQNYDGLTLQRPLIEGHISLDAVWGHIYDGGDCNASAIIMRFGDDHTVDGARIDRVWDAIRPASRDDEFYTIRDTWVSNARDDCVEADGSPPGLITDSLFDGCFQGISMRPGSGNTSENGDNILTIERSLFLMKAHNHSEANGSEQRFTSGQLFKHNGRSANVVINDTVVAFDTPELDGNESQTAIMMGDRRLGGRHGEDLSSCSNNTVLWLRDTDEAPLPAVMSELDPCFTVYTGEGARQRWDAARCEWIDEHPPSVTRRLTEDEGSECEGVSGDDGGSTGGGGTDGGDTGGQTETSSGTLSDGSSTNGGADTSAGATSSGSEGDGTGTSGDSGSSSGAETGAAAPSGSAGGCGCSSGRAGWGYASWLLMLVAVGIRRPRVSDGGAR